MTKSTRCLGCLMVMVLFLPIRVSEAGTILYFVDFVVGTDRMAAALAAVSGTHTTTTATSVNDFTTKLQTGNFQLGIFFQQNLTGGDYDAAFAALATHIANGGLAIADDFSQNNAHAAAFQASFAGGVNQTQFTVTDAGLAVGIGNPVDLIDPGWIIFATDEATGGGVVAATFPNATAAIIKGNGGRTYFNGFLNDTFDDGAEGTQLYINEINAVFVPEPTGLTLVTAGLGAMLSCLWWRKKRAATRTAGS
jgi:hypothetical protein